jgi:hypothetical protein
MSDLDADHAGQDGKSLCELRLDYQIDDVVARVGDRRARRRFEQPEIRANKPPQIEVQGRKTLTAKVGETVQLTASRHRRRHSQAARLGCSGAAVSNTGSRQITADDARQPRDAASGARHRREKRRAARVVVRLSRQGHGDVLAEQVMSWEDTRAGANSPWAPVWVAPPLPADGKVTVWATFSEPGVYVLRSRADDDGALTGDGQVTHSQ